MRSFVFTLLAFGLLSQAARYDPAIERYNLNQNKTATHPLDYWGQRTIDEPDHKYFPSPKSWRFPFYTMWVTLLCWEEAAYDCSFLDRWVNGDPTNDNINGTSYEHDTNSNQMRHGGDLQVRKQL